jgi:hypothetical protein
MNILLSKKYFYVRNDPLSILESVNDYKYVYNCWKSSKPNLPILVLNSKDLNFNVSSR